MSTAPRHAYERDFGGATYRIAAETGVIAASLGANSPLFSFRWGATDKVALVTSVVVSAMAQVGIAAGGQMSLEAIIARSFSASDTGGTALTLTTNNAKLDTQYPTTALTDARIATTGALGAGTRTLDAQGVGRVIFSASVAAAASAVILSPAELLRVYPGQDGALVLRANEGFIVRSGAAAPGTQTWSMTVSVVWHEVGLSY